MAVKFNQILVLGGVKYAWPTLVKRKQSLTSSSGEMKRKNLTKPSVLFPRQERTEQWRHKLIPLFLKNGKRVQSRPLIALLKSFDRKNKHAHTGIHTHMDH